MSFASAAAGRVSALHKPHGLVTASVRQQGPAAAPRPVPPAPRARRQGAAPAATAPSGGADEAIDVSGAYCLPAFVTADNKRSQCFTVLDVEVMDYPGLLRVISWCLNGLDIVAQNAVVRTTEDGSARNTFWLTSRSGHKLDDGAADLLAERVRDFVTYCSPDETIKEKTEFCSGPIMLSNSMHPEHTVVMVQEPRPTPGFLLEVASALSGMNVQILHGVVQGAGCEADPEDFEGLDAQGRTLEEQLDQTSCLLTDGSSVGRIFKFCIVDGEGRKLDYGGISALMYTLTSVLGYRTHPTVPPEQEMLMGAH